MSSEFLESRTTAARLLRQWAEFGLQPRLAHARKVPGWEAVKMLVDAAREKFQLEALRLQGLIQESNRRLSPLEDPLLTNLAAHRWLHGTREETYSDWLGWVVEILYSADLVFGLFGISEPEVVAQCYGKRPDVQREYPIPSGHEGKAGRLDLMIRYEAMALVVIEVKLGPAEKASLGKHTGYLRWVAEQPEPKDRRYPILLATSADQADTKGFRLLRWADLCINLRRMMCKGVVNRPQVVRAMQLAFVGAVEQNLLGYSAGLVRAVMTGRFPALTSAISEHLQMSLEEEPYGSP